jgi:hypothetical protein
VSAKRICTSEPPATAPLSAAGEFTSADEFLFAGVEAFMALAVVLSCESFAADSAYEWSFVCVGAEVRAEIIGAGESFRA